MFPLDINPDDTQYFRDTSGVRFKIQPSTMKRLKVVYEFIYDYYRHHGGSPTIREILNETPVTSTSVCRYYLLILERLNLITRDEEKARGIRLVGAEWKPPPSIMADGDHRPTYDELLEAINQTQEVLEQAMPNGSTFRVPTAVASRNPGELARMARLTLRAVRKDQGYPEAVGRV